MSKPKKTTSRTYGPVFVIVYIFMACWFTQHNEILWWQTALALTLGFALVEFLIDIRKVKKDEVSEVRKQEGEGE